MEPFHKAKPSALMIKEWMDGTPNLVAGITTRHGGISPAPFDSMNLGFHVPDNHKNVIENRHMIAKTLQIPLENWVIGEQVHNTAIAVVSNSDVGKGAYDHSDPIEDVDGMITRQHGLLCSALFADCVPLFFFDPITGWIGIAHAGWKGSVNRMAEEMVKKLINQGIDVETLRVAIGPCIGQSAYEVDDKVINHIQDKFREKVVITKDHGHYLLNLRELNRQILLESGVWNKNISVTEYCTFDDDLFFSHRRDKGTTGRMLGFIGYK